MTASISSLPLGSGLQHQAVDIAELELALMHLDAELTIASARSAEVLSWMLAAEARAAA